MTDDLSRFPRPSVAVDLAVFTVAPAPRLAGKEDVLCVLMLRGDDGDGLVLPGRFLRPRERVADSVTMVLQDKVGLRRKGVEPRLIGVFDDPGRDARGWTISLAHLLALPAHEVWAARAELAEVAPWGGLASGEKLKYDHDAILRNALAELRLRYENAPDPEGLLQPPYTLSELRAVHEAVLGEQLSRDAFNRRMLDRLTPLEDELGDPLTRRSVGRPAQLYEPIPEQRRLAAALPYPLPRSINNVAAMMSPPRRPRRR